MATWDDSTPTAILPPATIVQHATVLDFLPGQIAGALLASGRYHSCGEESFLASRTIDICEALVERMKRSPLWAAPKVEYPE